MKLLEGKKVLIFGVANDRSIAWGIAKACKLQGASIALSYVNNSIKKRVEPLAKEIGADFIFELDVTNDNHFTNVKKLVEEKWGNFDILVHSLAFADRNDLKGRFSNISREGFVKAFDISAFSFIALCHHLKDLINKDGSIMAMTYQGAQKIIPGYNVMGVAKAALESSMRYLSDDLGPEGIRVNCISAGPIRTLASSGVSGVNHLIKTIESRAPLRRNITIDDVGGTAVFLASNLSRGITGQTIFVDSGVSVTTI